MRTILHIDFNSYFATVEQQANPRLRGKPIGVTGGDRMERTVIGAASVEAKKLGVKTGMHLYEARRICPQIILVQGDSDKYLECSKRFLNILKNYSPYLEVFSIDETFLQINQIKSEYRRIGLSDLLVPPISLISSDLIRIAKDIKQKIRKEIGEWVSCSVGISYNKLMAKLASNLQKPDGLVVIANPEEAIKILDKIELDEICGIGSRIKKRLSNMGIFNFKQLRALPLECLLSSFKSYGKILYNMARGIDESAIIPFYEKEEVKSVGHRHTISHDTSDPLEIKQILLKLTELIARRLRKKKLGGRTVSCWYRAADKLNSLVDGKMVSSFQGNGMQITIPNTDDGLEIFKAAWRNFEQVWCREPIRMIGVSIANLSPIITQNLSFLDEVLKKETITKALDTINNKYGEFTLQRGVLLGSRKINRKANSFLADRRFRLESRLLGRRDGIEEIEVQVELFSN